MTKSTRRALLSNVVALLICLTMLIGTTFAWFTDTAQTAVNTIKSGTLDIDLQIYENDKWVTATGKTLNFLVADKDGNKTQGTNILWEPGCTYDLPELRIVNNGNLALKYKVVISGIKGDAELNEVIDWTIKVDDATYTTGSEIKLAPNATSKFTLSGSMKSTADNTYQGMKIEDIAITVVATQDTVEYDSTNNEYDKDATYPETDEWTVVTTAGALEEALNAGGNVKLGANIDLSERLTLTSAVSATLDLNGHTLTAPAGNEAIRVYNKSCSLTVQDTAGGGEIVSDNIAILVDKGTLHVKGGTLTGSNIALQCYNGSLTISGGTFNGNGSETAQAAYIGSSVATITGGTFNGVVGCNSDLTISGGTFNYTVGNVGTKALTITGGTFNDYIGKYSTGTVTITGGTITGKFYNSSPDTISITGGTFTGTLICHGTGTITITGGTFTGTFLRWGTGTFSITGGTFSVDPSDYVPSGYVATLANGKYTVAKSN